MKSPHFKSVKLHKDALKIYQKEIQPIEQLDKLYVGLRWLIASNYKIGTCIQKNYYVIKSSENIPLWHKTKLDLDKLSTITFLYSVWDDEIILEGINVRE